jgi:hypothetical protein
MVINHRINRQSSRGLEQSAPRVCNRAGGAAAVDQEYLSPAPLPRVRRRAGSPPCRPCAPGPPSTRRSSAPPLCPTSAAADPPPHRPFSSQAYIRIGSSRRGTGKPPQRSSSPLCFLCVPAPPRPPPRRGLPCRPGLLHQPSLTLDRPGSRTAAGGGTAASPLPSPSWPLLGLSLPLRIPHFQQRFFSYGSD